MPDALGYSILPESDISSNLPRIAFNKYKIDEGKRQQKAAEVTDMQSLGVKVINAWGKDTYGIDNDRKGIVTKWANNAASTGDYNAAKFGMQQDLSLLEVAGKLSTEQEKHYHDVVKDLEAQKKALALTGEKPEENKDYIQSLQNLQHYANLDNITPEDISKAESKYPSIKSMSPEAKRTFIRDAIYSEGGKENNLIQYTPKADDWQKTLKQEAKFEPTQKPIGLTEQKLGNESFAAHGKDIEYDEDAIKDWHKSFFNKHKDAIIKDYNESNPELKGDNDAIFEKYYKDYKGSGRTVVAGQVMDYIHISKGEEYTSISGGGYENKNYTVKPALAEIGGYDGKKHIRGIVTVSARKAQKTEFSHDPNIKTYDDNKGTYVDEKTSGVTEVTNFNIVPHADNTGNPFELSIDYSNTYKDGSGALTQDTKSIPLGENIGEVANKLHMDVKDLAKVLKAARAAHIQKYPTEAKAYPLFDENGNAYYEDSKASTLSKQSGKTTGGLNLRGKFSKK